MFSIMNPVLKPDYHESKIVFLTLDIMSVR
jgi:hypothetical protein